MKKYIKTIALTIVCLLLSVVVFASCGGNSETYIGTFYSDDGKVDITYTQKSDDSYSLAEKKYNGDKLTELHISGKLTQNKEKTNIEKINIDSASTKAYIDGKLIDSIEIDEEYKEIFSNFIKLRFGKDYVVFGDAYILYKKGAKKLANNEVIKVLTEKESKDKLVKDAYEADFYILKNASAPSSELQLNILYSHFDFCRSAEATITNIEGLNVSSLGKQNITITYDISDLNLNNQTLNASIMVVENERQLPENLIEEIKIEVGYSETNYVELVQGGDLASSSIVLKYKTKEDAVWSSDRWTNKSLTTETRDEFRIEGLDNTKLGFQEVTITHIETGVSAKLTVNVIDPKTPAEIESIGTIIIKDDNTLDLSNAKYTIKYVDGTKLEQIAITESDIIWQGPVEDYVNGDEITFKVSIEINGKTAVYYSTIDVVIGMA